MIKYMEIMEITEMSNHLAHKTGLYRLGRIRDIKVKKKCNNFI